jgi:hypothetical protein
MRTRSADTKGGVKAMAKSQVGNYKIVQTNVSGEESTVVEPFDADRDMAFRRFSEEWQNRTGKGALFLIRIDPAMGEVVSTSSVLRV